VDQSFAVRKGGEQNMLLTEEGDVLSCGCSRNVNLSPVCIHIFSVVRTHFLFNVKSYIFQHVLDGSMPLNNG